MYDFTYVIDAEYSLYFDSNSLCTELTQHLDVSLRRNGLKVDYSKMNVIESHVFAKNIREAIKAYGTQLDKTLDYVNKAITDIGTELGVTISIQ